MRFEPDMYDGEATIEVREQTFAVNVQVASRQRRATVDTMPHRTEAVSVGPRSWFGILDVPDLDEHAAFGTAVTQALIEGKEVSLVLPDGRRGVVEIDDSMWFEGRGPWPAP